MRKRKSSPKKPISPASSTDLSTSLISPSKGSDSRLRLYEPDATLDISRQMAEGFIILLTGGKENAQKKEKKGKKLAAKKIESSDSTLAFIAITDGNVIDACFGNGPTGGLKFSGSEYAVKSASNTKSRIRNVVEDAPPSLADRTKDLTINSYTKCFQIVVSYHDEVKAASFLSWCFKAKKKRKKAEKSLENCFKELSDLLNMIEQDSNL